MCINVEKIIIFCIWNYFKHILNHTLSILKLSWLYMWETCPMDEISNDYGWIFVVIFKIMVEIKQYFSFMHISKTHVILGFRVSNKVGKFILTLCLSSTYCVLCANCGLHCTCHKCKYNFYKKIVWVHQHIEQLKASLHPSSNQSKFS
jgi:hypothetical protein